MQKELELKERLVQQLKRQLEEAQVRLSWSQPLWVHAAHVIDLGFRRVEPSVSVLQGELQKELELRINAQVFAAG